MRISQLMIPNVIVAAPEASLKFAARIMEENDFDALPICENNRLIGMLTIRDIAVKAVAKGLALENTKISDFMTFEAQYVFADQSTEQVIKLMSEQHIRRLLVLDRDYHLVGIISLDDLVIANKIKDSFSALSPRKTAIAS